MTNLAYTAADVTALRRALEILARPEMGLLGCRHRFAARIELNHHLKEIEEVLEA